MKTRFAAIAAVLAVTGLGLTGCGQAQQAIEKVDVKQAAAWIDEADAVQVTMSIDADLSALKALARRDPSVTPQDETSLELLADAKVVAVASTKGEAGLGSLVVLLKGKDVVNVVAGSDDLYFKIDAPALPASLTSHLGDLAQLSTLLDLFAPGAGDALRNTWVHVESDQVKELVGDHARGTELTPDATTAQEVSGALKELLAKATIVQDPTDPSHKVVTIKSSDLKDTVTTLRAIDRSGVVSRYLARGKIPGEDVPDEISADVYVEDGDLRRLSIELNQFGKADESTAPVRLDLAFAEASPVVAPSGAKDLDLSVPAQGLLGQFSEKLGG